MRLYQPRRRKVRLLLATLLLLLSAAALMSHGATARNALGSSKPAVTTADASGTAAVHRDSAVPPQGAPAAAASGPATTSGPANGTALAEEPGQWERQPVKRIPHALLEPGNSHSRFMLVVEKSTQRLFVYEYKDQQYFLDRSMSCSTGQTVGDKKVEGDRKTPEGFYLFNKKSLESELPPIYGVLAFPMDYPNFWDIHQGKGGDGIWMHGINKKLKPLDSNGCVELRNVDIIDLEQHLHLYDTAVVIYDQIQYKNVSEMIQEKERIVGFLESWRQAWEKKDLKTYRIKYASNFVNSDRKGFNDWMTHKENLAKKYKKIKVDLKNIRIFRHRDVIVVLFDQFYKGDSFRSDGAKRLYLKEAGDKYQIVAEAWDNFPKVKDPPMLSAAVRNRVLSSEEAAAAQIESRVAAIKTAVELNTQEEEESAAAGPPGTPAPVTPAAASTDRKAQEEAVRKAEAEKKAQEDAVRKAEAEKKAQEEAVRKAEAEKKAKEEAVRKAEAEKKAQEEAVRKAEAEKKAKEEAVRKAEAEKKAQEEALRNQVAKVVTNQSTLSDSAGGAGIPPASGDASRSVGSATTGGALGGPDKDRVRGVVNNWLGAWQSSNMDGYLGYYHSDFRYKGMDLAEYRKYKNEMVKKNGKPVIQVKDVNIQMDGGQARVTFLQDFRSQGHRDFGRKTLILQKQGDSWRIREEQWQKMEE